MSTVNIQELLPIICVSPVGITVWGAYVFGIQN